MKVADRGGTHEVLGGIARSTVDVDDDGPLTRKVLQQPGADRLHHLSDRPGVVVGRDADEDIDLANVHQFAKKIIRKNGFFGQNKSSSGVLLMLSLRDRSWDKPSSFLYADLSN